MSAPMLGPIRHISVPAWIRGCACAAGISASSTIAAAIVAPHDSLNILPLHVFKRLARADTAKPWLLAAAAISPPPATPRDVVAPERVSPIGSGGTNDGTCGSTESPSIGDGNGAPSCNGRASWDEPETGSPL